MSSKNKTIFSVERDGDSLIAKVDESTTHYEVYGFLLFYIKHLEGARKEAETEEDGDV